MGVTYWSIVVVLIGGCVGSFLNVVIYRWSRDLSVRKPLRSFCPHCAHGIAWYDNLPVISYLFLGGRCRHCRATISWQYPAVEAATALTFLLTYDAFFVSRERFGIGGEPVDAIMFMTHAVLWAGLIALAVMDLESYTVDIRLTWIVLVAGLIGHTLWTPETSIGADAWIRPGMKSGFVSIAAAIGLALGMRLFLFDEPPEEDGDGESGATAPARDTPEAELSPSDDSTEQVADELETQTPEGDSPPRPPARRIWPTFATLVVLALLVGYVVHLSGQRPDRPLVHTLRAMTSLEFVDPFQDRATLPDPDVDWKRLLAVTAILFVGMTLLASHPHDEADAEIVESVAAEADDSRSVALEELLLVSPALLLMVAAILLLRFVPIVDNLWETVWTWTPLDGWQPVMGFGTALFGAFVGTVLGWGVRIIATLALGKEAMGMGDVHILAAAGAVAGWPVVVLGFFLSSLAALLAWVVVRIRRPSSMLPYGPWLAFGFLLASIFQDRILWFLNLRTLLD